MHCAMHCGEQDLADIAADTLELPGDYYAVKNGKWKGLTVLSLLVTATHIVSRHCRASHCGCTDKQQEVEGAATNHCHTWRNRCRTFAPARERDGDMGEEELGSRLPPRP